MVPPTGNRHSYEQWPLLSAFGWRGGFLFENVLQYSRPVAINLRRVTG